MATEKEWKQYEREMKQWLKEVLVWQRENPEKDWRGYINTQQIDGDIGGNPPPPPPPPPGN